MAISILIYETYPAAFPHIEIQQYGVDCVNSVSQNKMVSSLAKTCVPESGFGETAKLHSQYHTSVLTS